jgi:hypothetical protein
MAVPLLAKRAAGEMPAGKIESKTFFWHGHVPARRADETRSNCV